MSTHTATLVQQSHRPNVGGAAQVSAMTVRPELLILMFVCLQDGLALSLPEPSYNKTSITGNVTTSPSKPCCHLHEASDEGMQPTAVVPADTGGFQIDARNSSRLESRVGLSVSTENIFSANHQQHKYDFYRHSTKEPRISFDTFRRPEFYFPSQQTHLNIGQTSSYASEARRPNRRHESPQQSVLYTQPEVNPVKQGSGAHQFASRIYPYRVGPEKAKPSLDTYSHAHETSMGKPSHGVIPYSHEAFKAEPAPYEMPPADKDTPGYTYIEPYHHPQEHQPQDYHYDHSYDSYDYFRHTDVPEKPTTTAPPPPPPPPKKEPVVGHYRVGFKLFYIPLYAGIAFVAYVLLLIIKSISKHKGQVPYNFLTHPPERKLRDEIAHRVIRALETARRRYNT